MKVILKFLLISELLFFLFSCGAWEQPVSVILMIGDGMGQEQIEAASLYYYGKEGMLSFESLSTKGSVTTYSANSTITDSAAAATAMATGHKVNNHVISKAIHGDNSNLDTFLEKSKNFNKSVGLVTTTIVTHATPAAFSAHSEDRYNYSEIAEEVFIDTKPNVIFGGGGISAGILPEILDSSGYEIALNEVELNSLSGNMVCGLFGDTHLPYEYDGLGDFPTLSEMSLKALEILDQNVNGFFLMIEGGRIDHACHENDLQRMIPEVKAFSDAVQAVLNWMDNREDVLLIVTADHETGGLNIIQNNGKGEYPTVSWRGSDHSGVNVPVFSVGPGENGLSGSVDNTQILSFITF